MPNLFSCQSSSSLPGGASPVSTADPPERAWIASNPMFGVKATFFGPSTDSRLSHLTPNIRLVGGADRDRTGGLLVANQALSQLSYSPLTRSLVSGRLSLARPRERLTTIDQRLILVGLGRIELPTSPLSGVRSSQLSYRPGLPPKLPGAQYRASSFEPRASRKPKSSVCP